MPKNHTLAYDLSDFDALPLSNRIQYDADFDNLSRWIDGRLAGDGGGILEWHVVIADDDAANRLVLRSLLEQFGIKVTAVEDGSQALHAIASQPVDMVLLDINMPVLDGLETARAIRQLDNSKAELPLLAITSDVSPTRLAEMSDAGFDVCMEKPVRREKLFQLILGTLSRRVTG